MSTCTGISRLEHLERVPDPRVKRTQRHELMDILVIALCAVIDGADDWVGVVEFGKSRREYFCTFLKLPNGITSHDTFGRVFQILDSQMLEQVCMDWLQSIAGKVEGVVAIDGKSLCGSRSAKQSPLLQKQVPGPVRTACCWGKFKRTKSPTKSRPSPRC